MRTRAPDAPTLKECCRRAWVRNRWMIIFVVVMINLLPLMIALLSFLSAPDNHIIWIRLFSGTVSLSLVIGAGLFLADIQQIWMEPSPSEIEARDRKQYEKLKARFDQQEDTTNGHF